MTRRYATLLVLLIISALPAFASAATLGAPNTSALASGLIGYWPLDGDTTSWSTGRTLDLSGNSNTGSVSAMSTTTSPVPGKIGQAMKFDGTNSYIPVTDNNLSLDIDVGTISAWVKTTDAGSAFRGIYEQSHGAGLYLYSNAIATYDNGAAAARISSKTVNDGKWHHVLMTFSSGVTNGTVLYVDGVAVMTTTITNTAHNGVSIGVGQGGAPQRFTGNIDDVRVYSRVLSSTDIALMYAAGRSSLGVTARNALTSGLVGYWTFDGGDIGTSIADRSGNGFNGYLVGTNNSTSTRKVPGRIGQAFSFGGQNTGGINLGNSASLTPSRFTVAGWIYVTAPQASTYNYIYSNTRDNCLTGLSGIDFKVYTTNASLSGLICSGGTPHSVSLASAIATSTWTFVAFSYDGSNLRLYKNGSAVATQANTSDPGTASFNTYLGSMGNGNGTAYTLGGKLDDMRLYNRALSSTEIAQLYATGIPTAIGHSESANSSGPLSSGLVGYWTFDGPNINWKTGTATDSSGSGNSASLVSFSTTTSPTQGKVGQGLKFNGSSYVRDASLDNGSFPTNGTFSAWVNTSMITSDGQNFLDAYNATRSHVFVRLCSSGNGTCSGASSGNLVLQSAFQRSDGTFQMSCSGISMPTNAWVLVTVVWDTTNAVGYVYLNGSQVCTHAIGDPAWTPSQESVYFGQSGYKGKMDDVRLYSRVLSAAEVKQLYQLGR